jgi:succinate dehydrogenase/fumarate reductase cytochrome b subunit
MAFEASILSCSKVQSICGVALYTIVTIFPRMGAFLRKLSGYIKLVDGAGSNPGLTVLA